MILRQISGTGQLKPKSCQLQYNLYITLLSIYQFGSTLLNCKRTVSTTPAGPKNICNVSPTTWQSGAGNPLMLKLLKVTPPPTTKTDPSEVPLQSKKSYGKIEIQVISVKVLFTDFVN